MDQHNPIDYRLLVDNLTTAILLIDSNLNIFYLNSACEALFDISLLRASGQPVLNLLHAPDDTFNTHEALLNTIKRGNLILDEKRLLMSTLKTFMSITQFLN